MKEILTQPYYKRLLACAAALALFGVLFGAIFLSIEHNEMASPCAGMTQATCPLMQHGDIWNQAVLTGTTSAAPLHHAAGFAFALLGALALLLHINRPLCLQEHIRKRLAFLMLYNRYLQALFSGIVHSKLYA